MRREALAWWIILCALGAWYISLAPQHVLGGDNGEFALLAAFDGVAHPPGYPLYTSLLTLTRVGGLGSVAFRAALLSVVFGLATVALTRSMLLRFGVHLGTATLIALSLAVAPLFVELITQAEVFALHALLVVAVLWLCAPRTSARWQAGWLPFVFGCGFAHHQTLVWLVPLALPVYWRSLRGRWPWLGLGVLGFLAPASLYLRLPVFAEASAQLQLPPLADLHSAYGLFEFVMRRQYGTFSLASSQAEVPLAFEASQLVGSLQHNLTWFGLALAVFGLVKHRSWWLGLTWLGCGFVFVSLASLPVSGPAREVMSRFHLMPLLVMLPWMAWGLDALLLRWPRLLLAGLTALTALVSDAEVRHHHAATIHRALSAALESVPARSVIIAGDDAAVFGFLYLQYVEGQRPDVVTLGSGYLHSPRYRHTLAQRLQVASLPPGLIDTVRLLRVDRPVFINFEPGLDLGDSAPIAGLWQIGMPLPDSLTIEAVTLAEIGDSALDDELERNPDRWSFLVTRNYAKQLAWLSNAFEHLAREDLAYLYRSWSDGLLQPPS